VLAQTLARRSGHPDSRRPHGSTSVSSRPRSTEHAAKRPLPWVDGSGLEAADDVWFVVDARRRRMYAKHSQETTAGTGLQRHRRLCVLLTAVRAVCRALIVAPSTAPRAARDALGARLRLPAGCSDAPACSIATPCVCRMRPACLPDHNLSWPQHRPQCPACCLRAQRRVRKQPCELAALRPAGHPPRPASCLSLYASPLVALRPLAASCYAPWVSTSGSAIPAAKPSEPAECPSPFMEGRPGGFPCAE